MARRLYTDFSKNTTLHFPQVQLSRPPIHSALSLWSGIDILTAGCNVILPGSRTHAGDYPALRSFEQCAIPELPQSFVRLIRQTQKTAPQRSLPCPFPATNNTLLSQRQWLLLFRNDVFRALWKRAGEWADTTDSAYEFHLAKAAFLRRTRSPAGGERNYDLAKDTWTITQPKATRQGHHSGRVARSFTLGEWLACRSFRCREGSKCNEDHENDPGDISAEGSPKMPSSIAAALDIPRERVKKAVQPPDETVQLRRTKKGYVLG